VQLKQQIVIKHDAPLLLGIIKNQGSRSNKAAVLIFSLGVSITAL
jgi:hypothetical protein